VNNTRTILVIMSSADTLALKDGRKESIGYYLNELAIPVMAALDAGYQMVLATPEGTKPIMDPASVVASHFDDDEDALEKALAFANTYPAMQEPRSLRSVVEEGLDEYIAFYVPGGHPPMADLMQDIHLGEIFRHAHSTGKVTALLCHGPIAIAAAIPKTKEFRAALVAGKPEEAKRLAAGWIYAGYRMTVFSNDEEYWAEEHLMNGGKAPFYVNDALKIAGGDLSISGEGIFHPHLVEDRELITGQNPPSDHLMAGRLVKALDRYVQGHASESMMGSSP
jgi:putative intracellular protease/amidase